MDRQQPQKLDGIACGRSAVFRFCFVLGTGSVVLSIVYMTMKTRKSPSGGHLSALVHRIFAHLTALLIFIVSLGPIPKHVAFVMDGNRRYARGKGQKVREGHTEGFESLKRVGRRTEEGADGRYWKYALNSRYPP